MRAQLLLIAAARFDYLIEEYLVTRRLSKRRLS